MKLLLDENLSPRLVRNLSVEFPGISHIETLNLRGATDHAVWEFARDQDYAIVSKDNDFRQRSFLYGTPPKVIWLSIGNAGTDVVELLLRENHERIARFLVQTEEGLLVLQATQQNKI